MSKCFIGKGKFSKYYLYILGASLFKLLKNFFFGFMTINNKTRENLTKFFPKLSKYPLVPSLYKYISFIIGGSLFNYIISKNLANENRENNEKGLILKYLIHNKQNNDKKNKLIIEILVVSLLFFLHQEGIGIMYLYNFDGLDIWAFDIIFILLFMNKYFIINFYKHQKYSIIFIIIVTTPLLLLSSFLPYSNHNDPKEFIRDNNTYEIIDFMTGSTLYFLAIFIIFIFLSCIISYARVKSKLLMDFYYISPYKIVFDIGLMGFLLISIILTFTTIFSCKGREENIKKYCLITKDRFSREYYYDSIYIYFNELINKASKPELILEIFLFTPLYFIINFLEMTFEILIIMHLNPIYLLIRDNLFYFFIKIIFILFFVNTNFEYYITLKQFLILEICEAFALFGYSIYLEIIELRFFELENDLKKNIIKRADRESQADPFEDDTDSEENEIDN